MTTIAILPEQDEPGSITFRALAGSKEALGHTPGEALDALNSQLAEEERGTLLVIQQMRPDRFFTAEQQHRLAELMNRWRMARDSGQKFPDEDQQELEQLVEAEVRASGERAKALAQLLPP